MRRHIIGGIRSIVLLLAVLTIDLGSAKAQCNTDVCRALAKAVIARPRNWKYNEIKQEIELAKAFHSGRYQTCQSERGDFLFFPVRASSAT